MGSIRGAVKKMERMEFALGKYQEYNDLRDDLDAYLYALAQWALGLEKTKPDSEDYGAS